MNAHSSAGGGSDPSSNDSMLMMPLKILAWPFLFVARLLYKHWFSYLIGRVLRDENRVYSIKFIWYGDSVYLHPMIWGSVILFFVCKSDTINAGWPLFIWFVLLSLCFLTIMYNFNILKGSILAVSVVAVFGLAYVANSEWDWNPLRMLSDHIVWLKAEVTPGFYVASAYIFSLLICGEVFKSWLFNRVELDESYVYEHRFLQSTSREPIFARGLKRETKDLLELLILGAADIQYRTKSGTKRFKNVPGASLGLGTAIDSMLDYRRKGQINLEKKGQDNSDQARLSDAMHDMADGTYDDGMDDDMGDDGDAGDLS